MMQNDTLNRQIDFFKTESETRAAEIQEKTKDVGRLTQKLMT
jgi:hypothetical protein